jgi:hypothetical protein
MRNDLRRSRGQTLVITLIILFVLVTLGFVAMLVLGREVGASGISRERNIANDLAQAGVRYCFAQLRFSEDGADWRPQPATPVIAPLPTEPPGLGPESDPENPAATNPDPDFYWLRRRSDFTTLNPDDRGGPDGLGAFTRLNYDTGRALVRVRWSPSGPEIFNQNLSINEKGKLRAYTIIDSVGRPGNFNALDPTSARTPNIQTSRMLSAIVPIGIIESAYYVTNKDERNQPVDLGSPDDPGSNFMGTPVRIKRQIGGEVVQRPGGSPLTLGGSIYINGGLRLFGNVTTPVESGTEVVLNSDLGDQINVAGMIEFAESNNPLRIIKVQGLTANPYLPVASSNNSFSTLGGLIRDGQEGGDFQRFPRSVQRKEAPLVDEEDPNTGQLRYRSATRESGVIGPGGFNVGRLGFGRGIFINNNSDLNRDSEDGNYTQRFDWLNPNAHPQGFWQGPFYIPPAVFIELLPDGFLMSRNVKNPRDTWRNYNGADTGRHVLRFRLGYGSNGTIRIINELTPGVTNFGQPTPTDFDAGVPFSGIIFSEGNVRVRGVIPAIGTGSSRRGIQLTIVSMGTGYVEGSIIKGDPNTSSLALLCRDNVVLNTTQFLASSITNTLQAARDNNDPTSPARIKVDSAHNFDLWLQLPLDPLTGQPFITTYTYTNPNRASGNALTASIFTAHAAEYDRHSYINLLVNEEVATNPSYLFEYGLPNAASQFFPPGNPIITYGLADPGHQILPLFEKRSFQLFPIQANVNGAYSLLMGGMENVLRFKPDNTLADPGRGDYYFSRVAVQPMDVRIEAALYAQNGSFFVIPGPWFNPDPNDRRDTFSTAANRMAMFHATPEYPFYGEPIDVKITVVGSVSENFPPVMADQMQWLQKWGWIPAQYGMSGQYVPDQHFPRQAGSNLPDFTNSNYVPNLFINYDPTLISGRIGGTFDQNTQHIRTDAYGRPLPPMPKLPVGTRLMYFGEVNP